MSIKAYWNDSSENWFKQNRQSHEAITANPAMGFPIDVYPMIQKYMGDIKGKKILVP